MLQYSKLFVATQEICTLIYISPASLCPLESDNQFLAGHTPVS